MYDTGTKEGQEKRKLFFLKDKMKKITEKFAKTGNKKYLLQAEALVGEGDYIPGFDDGEQRISNNE